MIPGTAVVRRIVKKIQFAYRACRECVAGGGRSDEERGDPCRSEEPRQRMICELLPADLATGTFLKQTLKVLNYKIVF